MILDNHRSEAGNSAESNGLWYTSAYSESAWINDWVVLANRYKGVATVVGADLRNEPHNATSAGSCWGCGSTPNDWRLAAERGGNAVLAANPNWLIFVEGTDCYNGDCDWWGGNLEGAKSFPVTLNLSGRLVYSAHDYGPHEYGQSWFTGSTTSSSLDALWTKFWAYLSLNGTAPVWVGEFGTTNNASDISNSARGSQGQWFQSLVSFLKANPNISWTYWALNGEDTYGILDSQYDSTPASAAKQMALASIQSSGGVAPSCQSAPGTPGSLVASSSSSSQINVSWSPATASPGCNVSYNVYGSETQNFSVSTSSLIASGLPSNAYSAVGLASNTTYYFAVTALDSAGQSAPSSEQFATTKVATTNPPTPPSALHAVATSANAITLSWQPSSSSGVAYNVYRGQSAKFTPSASSRIATGVIGSTYANGGLTVATSYYYFVTAVASGESDPSNEASTTTLSNSAGSSCHVVYTVNSQWNNGFNVGITIQNTGSVALSSVDISLDLERFPICFSSLELKPGFERSKCRIDKRKLERIDRTGSNSQRHWLERQLQRQRSNPYYFLLEWEYVSLG